MPRRRRRRRRDHPRPGKTNLLKPELFSVLLRMLLSSSTGGNDIIDNGWRVEKSLKVDSEPVPTGGGALAQFGPGPVRPSPVSRLAKLVL